MYLSRLTKRFPILRLSALRQAVFLTGAFLILLFGAGLFALDQFEREFEDRIEAELKSRFTFVASEIREGGFNAAKYPQSEIERIVYLTDAPDIRAGFHHDFDFSWRSERRDRFGHGKWMYLVGRVNDGQLIVGTNLGRRDEFLEIILQTMGFVGLAAAIVALLFGLYSGFRTQRRLGAISSTLGNVASGDLNARVHPAEDNDDLDELAHQVDETIAKLDVLMRQSRDFSANIAHDLKTPLARLRIRLENALTAEIEDGDSAEYIGLALEQTDKVIAIFDAFLRIAKLESGAAKASFEPVNLGQLAHETFEIYELVVDDSGRSLSLEIDDPLIIQGDRVLVIQMLANLIENALRHTPEGTQLNLIAKGNELGLCDTGPGIPADEYARIVQPLYRLEKSRTTEGAGLGLSLVKTIATLHGAELKFSENPSIAKGGLYVRAIFPNQIKRESV